MAVAESTGVAAAYREMWGEIAQLQALAEVLDGIDEGPSCLLLVEPHVRRAVEALGVYQAALRAAGVDASGDSE